ncbi:MAG: ABC transporter ATP-binding protein [Chloroflexota bacterium]
MMMFDKPAAVTFSQVTKCYQDVAVVHDLTFMMRRGSVTAILGRNGAGKTTTISMMLGMIRPTSGTISLMGGDPRQPRHRRCVGAMLQTTGAPETLRVNELIRLWSRYYPHPLPLDEVMARAGLVGLEQRRFGRLSGGQQRRVAFALALCGRPPLLILDEPTTGLDIDARRGFWEQIRAFAADGGTVVFSTHYLEEADVLADRILLMDRGHLIRDGSPEAIKSHLGSRRIRCVTTASRATLRRLPHVVDVHKEGRLTHIIVNRAEPVVHKLLQLDPALTDLEVRNVTLDEAVRLLTQNEELTP